MDTRDKLIEKLKNTILIKAGDKRVKLGQFSMPPKVDCRVISEELYQEVLSILEKQVEVKGEIPIVKGCHDIEEFYK